MKKLLFCLSFIALVSCKKELADIKPGTDVSVVKKEFGEPKKTGYLFGAEFFNYGTHFIFFKDNKVERVYTKDEFNKKLDEIENSFQQLQDFNNNLKDTRQDLDETIKNAEKALNAN